MKLFALIRTPLVVGQWTFLNLPAWQEKLLVLDRLLHKTFFPLRESLKFPINCLVCWDQYTKKNDKVACMCHKINVKESCKNYKQPFLTVQEALSILWLSENKNITYMYIIKWSFINFNIINSHKNGKKETQARKNLFTKIW